MSSSSNLTPADKNTIIDEINNNSKVGRVKTKVKYFSKQNKKTAKS